MKLEEISNGDEEAVEQLKGEISANQDKLSESKKNQEKYTKEYFTGKNEKVLVW